MEYFVGSISAIAGEFEKQRTVELGYWVARSYWGKGIASGALQKFTDLLFENTDFIRLNASVFDGNLVSAKVLQKCGYTLKAVLEKALYKNGVFFDERLYSKIRS